MVQLRNDNYWMVYIFEIGNREDLEMSINVLSNVIPNNILKHIKVDGNKAYFVLDAREILGYAALLSIPLIHKSTQGRYVVDFLSPDALSVLKYYVREYVLNKKVTNTYNVPIPKRCITLFQDIIDSAAVIYTLFKRGTIRGIDSGKVKTVLYTKYPTGHSIL